MGQGVDDKWKKMIQFVAILNAMFLSCATSQGFWDPHHCVIDSWSCHILGNLIPRAISKQQVQIQFINGISWNIKEIEIFSSRGRQKFIKRGICNWKINNCNIKIKNIVDTHYPVCTYILDAFTTSGILKAKQKLGVTFNSDKLGDTNFTKFSKLTMCTA